MSRLPKGWSAFDRNVRLAVSATIHRSSKPIDAIAIEMSKSVGYEVTVAMLRSHTAKSKRAHRFPVTWIKPLCEATGNYRVLHLVARECGFRMVTVAEADVARKFLDREDAERALKIATEAAVAERSKR